MPSSQSQLTKATRGDQIVTRRKQRPIRPVLEKTMPIHAIKSFPNPASFPVLCSNLKNKKMEMMKMMKMEKFIIF